MTQATRVEDTPSRRAGFPLLLKDGKLKVQATIQGDAVRVAGAKQDLPQEAIALVKKTITDYPLSFGNFRN